MMKQFLQLAAVAIIGLGTGMVPLVPAYAQSARPDTGSVMTADNKERVSKLIGAPVFNEQGEQFGTIDDVLLSPSGAEPVAVLSVGGFLGVGTKLVAVPLSHVRLQGANMTMAHATRQELTHMLPFGYYNPREGQHGNG
jgi:hypothetical protein